jgi:ABC-type polysaccharide/polyol phosphate export permease
MALLKLFGEFFAHLYQYREYLKQSVARDLRRHYKRSVLGYLWSMLNPLFMMIILAVVFSKVMRFQMDDYAVFLFTGMIPWSYFQSSSTGSLGSIRANATIIQQVPVPKYIFPLSYVFSNLVTLFLSLVPLMVIILALGRTIHPTILLLPVVLVPLFLITTGVSLIFAVSNVFFEDTQHLVGILMQALYFLSPILYSREILPHWLQPWVVLNPMFGIIECTRDIIYFGNIPNWETYFLNLAGALVLLAIGLFMFKKAENKFVYFM